MTRLLISIGAACAFGAVALTARAHHSFAVHFDPTGQASVQGTVADIRIGSPHSFLELDGETVATDESGMFGEISGRVKGDTIVVESSGFPDLEAGMASDFDPNGVGADVPSSAQKEFTERYSLSDDGQRLMVEYTIVDPVYLTESYTGSTQWSRLADGTPIEPFECDVETAAQSTSQGAG